MKKASTITEAAFGPFETSNRDVWRDDVAWPSAEVYVSRAGGPADAPESKPYLRLRRRLLKSRDAQRMLLHGQIGSGKSMELHQLTLDPEIRTAYEVVSISLADRLNLAAEVNVRLVLLALAQELARTLVEDHGQKVGRLGWAADDEKILAEWLRVLTGGTGLSAPDKVIADDWLLKLSAGLLEKTIQVRSDDSVRQALTTSEAFAPSKVRDLVHALLVRLHRMAERSVLLVVDDGDKIGDDEAARDVFVRNLHLLLGLPCSSVLTVPFWLHFDPDYKAAARNVHRVTLNNVKVISRDNPDQLADPGRQFFQALYDRLAERALIEPTALELAARTSGGVPREFIRLLAAGFDLADERGATVLDQGTLRAALALVRREMLGFTQDQQVREALGRIHRTRRLSGLADWKLLNALLVVEYTNDEPWYDAHPLLLKDAEAWAGEADG